MFLFFKKSDTINFEKDAVKLPGIKDFFSNFKARNLETFWPWLLKTICSTFHMRPVHDFLFQMLSQFYPDILETNFVQILSTLYLDKIVIKSG